MIESLQSIEFIRPSGQSIMLLNIGEDIDAYIPFPVEQRVSSFAPIGASWSYADAYGGARSQMAWSVIRNHSSHQEAHRECVRASRRMPLGEVGQIRLTIRPPEIDDDSEDEVWIFEEAVVASSSPVPYPEGDGPATLTNYRVEMGRRYPTKGEFSMCDPVDWQTVDVDLDTRAVDDTTCAISSDIPPTPTPGNPPDLIG